MRKLSFVFAALACAAASIASAQPVRIASWNLGWHVSQAEVPKWIERCSRSFVKDASDGIWKPVAVGTQGSTVGSYIKESRAPA